MNDWKHDLMRQFLLKKADRYDLEAVKREGRLCVPKAPSSVMLLRRL